MFNTNTGGILVSGPVTNSAVSVSNGLFTVAVDFGSKPFTLGQRLWLEIGGRQWLASYPRWRRARRFVHAHWSMPTRLTPVRLDRAGAPVGREFGHHVHFAAFVEQFSRLVHWQRQRTYSVEWFAKPPPARWASRLSANVPLLNAGNTYTGLNVYNNLIKVGRGCFQQQLFCQFSLEESTSDTGDFLKKTKWDNVGNKRFSISVGNRGNTHHGKEHGGNVGIDTNETGASLEVNGNAQIDGPSSQRPVFPATAAG